MPTRSRLDSFPDYYLGLDTRPTHMLRMRKAKRGQWVCQIIWTWDSTRSISPLLLVCMEAVYNYSWHGKRVWVCEWFCACVHSWVYVYAWVCVCVRVLTQSGVFALGGCSQGTLAPTICLSTTIVAENPSSSPDFPRWGIIAKSLIARGM